VRCALSQTLPSIPLLSDKKRTNFALIEFKIEPN